MRQLLISKRLKRIGQEAYRMWDAKTCLIKTDTPKIADAMCKKRRESP